MHCEQSQKNQHQGNAFGVAEILEQNCGTKGQERQKRVRARDYRILINEDVAEHQQPADEPRKWSFEEQHCRAGNSEERSDVADGAVAGMKHVLDKPQNCVPERGRAFIAHLVEPDHLQAEISGDEPCLRFIRPFFVILKGPENYSAVGEQHQAVADLPPIRRWLIPGRCCCSVRHGCVAPYSFCCCKSTMEISSS